MCAIYSQGSTGIAFSAGTGTGIGKKCRDRDFAGTGIGTENFSKFPKFSKISSFTKFLDKFKFFDFNCASIIL